VTSWLEKLPEGAVCTFRNLERCEVKGVYKALGQLHVLWAAPVPLRNHFRVKSCAYYYEEPWVGRVSKHGESEGDIVQWELVKLGEFEDEGNTTEAKGNS
jgi:hypothetical protein